MSTHTVTQDEAELPTEEKLPVTSHAPELLSLGAMHMTLTNAALDVVIESTATGARRAAHEYKRLCLLLGNVERRGSADLLALESLLSR